MSKSHSCARKHLAYCWPTNFYRDWFCQVKAGDVIVKVGQINIQNQPLSNLRDLILGEPGTFVVLGFQRGAQVFMRQYC